MRESLDNVNYSDVDVLELIHRVMHMYRSRQFQALRDGAHPITHMQSKALAFFARHPGATQSELAAHSGRDKAQLARLVNDLREQGLLDGQPDPHDRRHLRLALTASGKAVQRGVGQQAQRLSAVAVRGLTTAERSQLLALLQRVSDNLDASR